MQTTYTQHPQTNNNKHQTHLQTQQQHTQKHTHKHNHTKHNQNKTHTTRKKQTANTNNTTQ